MAATRETTGLTARSTGATARLMWAACRPSPDTAAVVEAVESGADLERAALISLAQRTGPLLWTGLTAAGVSERLEASAGPLRGEFMRRRAQAELLLPLAVRTAIEPLTEAGLEPMIFKGPAIARRYPHPGLRPMDDLDVILPVHHDAGVAVLEAAGWWVSGERGTEKHKDTLLRHPLIPDLPLELHRDIALWRQRWTRMHAVDLWRNRQPIECCGTQAFGLCAEEELVALAVHAGKPYHQFSRLIWSVDLAVLAESEPDWDRVAALADRYGATTVVAVGLRHARRLGAEVPDELLALPTGRLRSGPVVVAEGESWPLIAADEDSHRGLAIALTDSRPHRLSLILSGVTGDGPAAMPRHLASRVGRGMKRWRAGRRNTPPTVAAADPAATRTTDRGHGVMKEER